MTKHLSIILVLFSITFSFAQDINRVEIEGKVIVDSEDKEGITVYNTSSNKGTVTDALGQFKIKVALNDIVDFGALQFKHFQVTITEDILVSKQLTVVLVEEVKKLDEVIILPYGLTGNLSADVESVRTFNVNMDAVFYGLEHDENFQFSADYKSAINNPSVDDQLPSMRYGLNVINVVKLIARPFVDESPKANSVELIPIGKLNNNYDADYLNRHFNIPRDRIDEFITYIEKIAIDSNLLKVENELLFLEYIKKLSQDFLN
ncbi:MAG: hypothetical protein HKN99_07775 [Winogradskyella sp.]|nr:carboxypeptidase-like regulatory domain-containing protein [Winogradskyella sp.]MBT8376969.1 carboxypeptidase-like regulatory domain-containing protein [Bacteroidia bacterium]NNC45765.1 hypothetical protein [Winogradskyella sp.]NNF86022.1 hypothetical protein [Winogradskyella sp.]NNK40473.1 hypothetical protein [Winogradskyella sp.]